MESEEQKLISTPKKGPFAPHSHDHPVDKTPETPVNTTLPVTIYLLSGYNVTLKLPNQAAIDALLSKFNSRDGSTFQVTPDIHLDMRAVVCIETGTDRAFSSGLDDSVFNPTDLAKTL